jgi:hypothetical protein
VKQRISKSEIDLLINSAIKRGEIKISDTKVGTKRYVKLSSTTYVFTDNGWMDIL